MTKKKRILVACGTAIATSTVVARKIEEELEKRGIKADITQCKASEVPSHVEGHDLVVTTTLVSGTRFGARNSYRVFPYRNRRGARHGKDYRLSKG